MTFTLFSSIGGWVGMAMLLYAYAARNRLSSRSYALLNLFGAMLVGVNCFVTEAWPAMALQTAWAAIAIFELCFLRRPPNPTVNPTGHGREKH